MKIRGKQTGGDVIPSNMILYKNTDDQNGIIEENKKYLGSCQVCDIKDNIGNNIEIIRSFLSETDVIIDCDRLKTENKIKNAFLIALQNEGDYNIILDGSHPSIIKRAVYIHIAKLNP